MQNSYTSFLLWTDNNYLSNSTLYKDFILKETKNKPTVIVEPQYQLKNIAYTRVLGVRFLTRWILVSHETSYK